ncbi:MAG: hypothetical protein L6R38_000590 [Xanthoria sp. 2 TBL-2021]|nr:MAG: hypothetical protein L6R38_000590 [Xanthoria sp. 2 TBL-2021]
MLSGKLNKRFGQGSSIPQSTPKHKSEINLESAKETGTTNIIHGNRMTILAVHGATRKQEAPSSLNHQELLDKHSAALATQPNAPFSKKTAIPQPGLSLLGKPKPNANADKSVSSDGAVRSKAISSDGISVSSSKGYTKPDVTAVKSNVGLKRHGRSRSQVVPSRSPNQQGRVPSHESMDSRTEASAASGRTVSQRSMKSSTSVTVPREVISECDEGLSEEIRHIQRELLRLHILHSTSVNNQDQWRTSAKIHFHKRFGALKERHTEIADISYQTQELKNRSALVDWCRNAQGSEIGKRVHILSTCIYEVYNDVGFGGKYNQTIQTFQAWYDRAGAIRGSRQHDTMHDTARLGYVEEIGAGWHDDVNTLQTRLGTLTGDLRALGSASASSNLGQVLILLHDLVIDMLTELDCIRSIEGELVTQERLWFDEQITILSLKFHSEMEGARNTPCRTR